MPQTASITGTLSIPAAAGVTGSPVPLALNLTFAQRAALDLEYDTPVTDASVPLGTMSGAGAKWLFLTCTLGSCSVKINGMTTAIPLSVGAGYILIANSQQGVVTAVTVTTSAPAILQMIGLA